MLKKRDIIFLTLLFLIVLFVRTVPFQGDTQLPLGEGDAIHQMGRALNMMDTNRAPRELPFYLAAWYTSLARLNYYSPYNGAPFFINTAILGIFSGDHLMGANIWLGISSIFFMALALFLLVKKMYGFWPAVLSSLLIVFDRRLVWSYIWGQRTILMAFSMLPATIYCYYRYTKSVLDGEEKPVYFFMTGAFMAMSGFFHPYVGLFSIALVGVLTLILWVKEKKIPFVWKTAIISIAIFAILFLPFFADFAAHTPATNEGKQHFKIQKVGTLFKWFVYPTEQVPNPQMYDFRWVNGGIWLMPLIFLGVIYLLMRRKNQDIFMLTWLSMMYIFLHLNVINLDIYPIDRLVKGTSLIFYPLAAIGLFSIPKLFKLPKTHHPTIKQLLIVVFLGMMLFSNAKPVYEDLKNAYPGEFSRMTTYQQDAAAWIDVNLPEHAIILGSGPASYPKLRWIHVLGKRALIAGMPGYYTLDKANELVAHFPETNTVTHLLFDYSDYAILGNAGYNVEGNLAEIQKYETEYAKDAKLLYDQGGIRIYDLRSEEVGKSKNKP